jgi:hypothetical protein
VIGSQESGKSADLALLPAEWRGWPGIVAGFGNRFAQPPPAVVRIGQVHGARVVPADGFAPGLHADVEGDAVVVRRGTLAAVATADCVPILLADPTGGAAGPPRCTPVGGARSLESSPQRSRWLETTVSTLVRCMQRSARRSARAATR